MKMLSRENLPRWYGFGWQDKPPRILLYIHKHFLERIRSYPDGENSIIEHLKKEFGFTKFDWSFHEGFGFDDAIRLVKMEDAMRKAYVRMLRADYLDSLSFRASVENERGWLNVSCPGSACGLHPTDHFMRDGYGFEFSSHNVDTPAQQLTLLAGLAALHDRVDQELQARQ